MDESKIMKKRYTLLLIFILLCSSCAGMRSPHRAFLLQKATDPETLPMLRGRVKKVISQNDVHFVKLIIDEVKVWAAVLNKKPSENSTITIKVHLERENYYSKYIDKNFSKLIFASVIN